MATATAERSRIRSAGTGLVLASAAWLGLGVLGIPALLGLAPVGHLGWAALAGALFGAVGLLPVIWFLLAATIGLLFLVGWTPLLDHRLGRGVRSDPGTGSGVSAVVVLSGQLGANGRIGGEAAERLAGGVALRRRLGVPRLVLTEIRRTSGGRAVSSEPDQRALVARLDSLAEVEFVGPVRSTHDEAVATAALARRRGWRRVAVVTSPLHAARACASFQREGLSVFCSPVTIREYSPGHLSSPAERLAAFRDRLYEEVATVVYRLRGWLPVRAIRNPGESHQAAPDAATPQTSD